MMKSLQICERKGYLQRSILCKTLAGNPVPLLTVTNFNATPEEINFLLGLDTIWMPILVAEHRNRTRPKNKSEFLGRKVLY